VNRPIRLVSALAALLASPALVAQTTPDAPVDPVRAAFDRADTDRDGRLSRAEAARLPTVGPKFEQYDENRDGYLSFEEYRTGFPVAPLGTSAGA
jgi:Ca2+-binding EF-hand superfamily protein